jgi:S-adenosylmethionine decarboxylase proenzyme
MTTDMVKPYKATLSTKFMVSSVAACSALAFGIGQVARMHLVPTMPLSQQQQVAKGRNSQIDMPTPIALQGKEIPGTIYTSKNFDSRKSATIFSQWLQKDPNSAIPEPINERLANLNETTTAHEEEDDDEEHLPAGQHLLVDMDNIEADFLDSEGRLATAMVDLVNDSGLTLLSYHCHGLTPAGVSCAGVLLESHVSFHTWPAEGVITLDLFTCGSASLLDSMKLIENLFAVPRNGPEGEQPTVLWAYKRRGFKDQISDLPHNQPGSPRDTFAYPLGIHGLDFKKEVSTLVQCLEEYGRITHNLTFSLPLPPFSYVQVASAEIAPGKHAYVYDLIQGPHQSTESYMKSLSNDGSYEAQFPELFRPNRLFYYNGVLKSSRLGEAAAYESFVHPAMLAHAEPKKVLVFGAGAGASLREILKHTTVEQVAVVGADYGLLDFAREHLQDWNDCSHIGRAKNCFDDARVKMVDSIDADEYDVVLVDLEFSSETMDHEFFQTLTNSLSEEGVTVFHMSHERPADMAMILPNGSKHKEHHVQKSDFVTELASVGFAETREYREKQVGFPEPRNYVVAFKNSASNWGRNEAQVTREMLRRTAVTTAGDSSLEFFDGAKMSTYSQYSGHQSSLNCLASPTPLACAASIADYQNQQQPNNTAEEKQCGGSPELPACNFADYLQTYPWKDTHVVS